jgi:hypothetical protein
MYKMINKLNLGRQSGKTCCFINTFLDLYVPSYCVLSQRPRYFVELCRPYEYVEAVDLGVDTCNDNVLADTGSMAEYTNGLASEKVQ